MLTVIRDLLRHDGRFRIAFVFLLLSLIMAVLSFVSPYDPGKTFWCLPMSAILEHILRHQLALGRTSSGGWHLRCATRSYWGW